MSSYPNTKTKFTLISVVLFLTLGLDQITKVWARETLGGQVWRYANDLLVFEHSENPGAFLSLGANMSDSQRFWLFTIGVGAVSIAAFWYLFKKKDLSLSTVIAYTLMISGGIGNLIDRIMKGTVTDFINMGFGSIRTGIFNVADMAIMAAAAILIIFTDRGIESVKK